MPNPIKDELVATQSWIFDAGFRIVSYHYYARSMGTSDVELESDELRMRWVRDRGTVVFAELAPAGERLWGLTQVIETVTGAMPEYDATKLDQLASLFRENLGLLKRALGPDWPQTKAELERRRQERLRAAMTRRPITREAARTLRILRFRRFVHRWGRLIAVAVTGALILWIATR